ncbi:M17 family metallopeptidase [Colwelliaceae bacterium 6471]
MDSTLIVGTQGTPLIVVQADCFDTWLSAQTPHTQNWLQQTQYSGTGLANIPDSEGNLAFALFVDQDLSHYYACGDLVNNLPAGQYMLEAQEQFHQAIAYAWAVGCYQFDRYKENKKNLPSLAINNEKLVTFANRQAQATALVRDLVNTPASDMMPEELGVAAAELAEKYDAEIHQIIGDELLDENYPTIHAVGRASVHSPRLIDLHWGEETHPQVTLVGKGVCFDSGGLDIKPAAGMRNMKKDMGGAAHVLGLAQLIMANDLPIRLRVLIPAVENAVSNNAFRPGDVITTRKGLTVEIDNTDAEGRLVLCDALAEAENDQPELLIDFATLTGAMRVALGTELPGFFSTSDDVAAGITQGGSQNSDPVWRMPLYSPYQEHLKSQIADMTNCSSIPFGGAISAALYLQEFVNTETDWVHFDVMAWNIRALPGRPIGGEAFGIRAVFQYLQTRFG